MTVIWIGFQDRKEKIKEFVSKHDVRSSVGFDDRNKISKRYGINYGAGLVMIDRGGIVKKRVPKGFSEKVFLNALSGIVTVPAETR